MISEMYHGSEVRPRERLPYGAVPLDPWKALHPENGMPYYNTSLDRIAMMAGSAVEAAIGDGRLRNPDTAASMHDLLLVSLIDAHTRRLLHNSHANLEDVASIAERVTFEAALEGTARPDELYDLLRAHPEMGSIELAKLTHPFDFTGSAEMDGVVRELLAHRIEPVEEKPRFKVKRVDPNLPALIVVRKQVVGAELLDDGFIELIERRSLLVRGDDEATAQVPYVDRMIKNPERRDELTDRIESQLPDADNSTVWLQPTTTSYYACYHAVN